MSCAGASAVNLDPSAVVGADTGQRRTMLRQAVGEMVGVTFFGQMLAIARNSGLKGEFGHGGRGEDIFRAQLDQELARRAGQAGQAASNSLTESIYQRFAKRA